MTRLSERFDKAVAYAIELHRNQRRKGSEVPYLGHVLGVASIAIDFGADEDEAIAAVLHDVVEDQGGASRLAEVRNLFGPEVAKIVESCSDTDRKPKPPWRERKEAYVLHLEEASPSARLVSAADKIHNARAIISDHRAVGPEIWNRFTATRKETLWYYGAVLDALVKARGGKPGPLEEELAPLVRTMEGLA